MKKYAIITGATRNGIGAGFARRLLVRGYTVYLQYRDESAHNRLQILFPDRDVVFFKASLQDSEELVHMFAFYKDQGLYFSVVVLAAGTWAEDSEYIDPVKTLSAINGTSKKVVLDAFSEVYKDQSIHTVVFLISSHISDISIDDATRMGQLGYVSSMKQVNDLAAELASNTLFEVHLLKTVKVDTSTLTKVKEKIPGVTGGESADIYAEEEVTKAGL